VVVAARLQIIDRLLTSVLEWPHNQIRTEVYNDGGYGDYAFVENNGRYLAVLEAKTTGLLRVETASKSMTDARIGGQVLRHAMDLITQAIVILYRLGHAGHRGKAPVVKLSWAKGSGCAVRTAMGK
jgi:hypothetical protein